MGRAAPVAAVGLAIAFAAVPSLAPAQHGWGEYDWSSALQLAGRILESGYEHPHGFVRLETPGKIWLVVLAPPSRMERRGLPREMLKPGAAATVEGYASRGKPDEMRAARISIQGKTIELR